MERGMDLKKAVIVGAVVLVILVGGAYLLFFGGGEDGSGKDDQNIEKNRSPVADAGRDITVKAGELFNLSGWDSSDPDGDPLSYYWDMDAGTDSNSDGINDNDRDREGVNITYSYPITGSTTTYIVTLNVSDGDKWDTSTVRVTVIVEEEPLTVSMSCRYEAGYPPLIEAQFILSVDSVSRNESFTEFHFTLEDPEGDTIRQGAVLDLINLSTDAEIRYIDNPLTSMGEIDGGDVFTLKENQEIVEGCVFKLYYLNELDPAGEVERIVH